MRPIRTPQSRKLVLGRETLRALSRPRTIGPITLLADETSCGEVCTCACPTETY